jgi:hypothetical protein
MSKVALHFLSSMTEIDKVPTYLAKYPGEIKKKKKGAANYRFWGFISVTSQSIQLSSTKIDIHDTVSQISPIFLRNAV